MIVLPLIGPVDVALWLDNARHTTVSVGVAIAFFAFLFLVELLVRIGVAWVSGDLEDAEVFHDH